MVQGLGEALTDLRTYVEAAIDFPEEEIDFLADAELTRHLETVLAHFDGVVKAARQGQLLRDGITVVIAGAPNAGKSSLLNRLAGYDAAIVSDIPGTTRDVLRERIDIDGLPLHVIDTAGLRESGNVVETEGVRRARAELARADRILFVVDAAADPESRVFERERTALPPGLPVTLIMNKADLVEREPSLNAHSVPPRIWMSARTGAGMDLLRAHLKACVGFAATEAGNVSARRRHLDALARARRHVEVGSEQLRTRRAGELMAEELRQAQAALGEITGEVTSDDLLGRIFATFCIGK
jgi:tRNA modification GTPase